MTATVKKMDANDIKAQIKTLGTAAKTASRVLASSSEDQRNRALNAGAAALRAQKEAILVENAKDMAAGEARGLSGAMLDRLLLDDARIEGMAAGLEAIAKLADPVGNVLTEWTNNALHIKRVATPLGVIGVIYESRPNVTADAGALCLKSGNAAILRGGSESFHSSAAIMQALQTGLEQADLPAECIQSIPTTDREAVGEMLRASEYIDVIVPRGGKSLIQRIMADSKIPTFQHLEGNCHSYIHASADINKALAIAVNAKMRRTGVCGATETIVVDEAVAAKLLPQLVDALTEKDCEIRGDATAQALDTRIVAANAEDWDTEYLDAIVAVKIVSGLEAGIAHVQQHSSSHTDAIIAEDASAVEAFMNQIDSAIVMHNTSTQFADGGEFGMGAEIGIATGKMHARGPVGIEQLCTFQYQVTSGGATRA